jgi:hypothetical protein
VTLQNHRVILKPGLSYRGKCSHFVQLLVLVDTSSYQSLHQIRDSRWTRPGCRDFADGLSLVRLVKGLAVFKGRQKVLGGGLASTIKQSHHPHPYIYTLPFLLLYSSVLDLFSILRRSVVFFATITLVTNYPAFSSLPATTNKSPTKAGHFESILVYPLFSATVGVPEFTTMLR